MQPDRKYHQLETKRQRNIKTVWPGTRPEVELTTCFSDYTRHKLSNNSTFQYIRKEVMFHSSTHLILGKVQIFQRNFWTKLDIFSHVWLVSPSCFQYSHSTPLIGLFRGSTYECHVIHHVISNSKVLSLRAWTQHKMAGLCIVLAIFALFTLQNTSGKL